MLVWLWRKFPWIRHAFGNRVREAMLDDARYSAKFWPAQLERNSYLVEAAPPRSADDPLPLPPVALRWGAPRQDQEFLESGRKRVERMAEILEEANFPLESCRRVLDFGAATGVMLRWLPESVRRDGEAWGVDISGEAMLWCQQNLSPPFRFATTTSAPHLPFEDNYFDLVYAGSVFTHIADLADAWLLELKRVVRPGGHLFLTVQDEHSIKLYLEREPQFFLSKVLREQDAELQFSTRKWDLFTLDRMPGAGANRQAQVFYSRDYLRRHWGQYLDVVSVHPEGYWVQTVFLLQK